jgi:hypothetical protein
MHEEHWPPRGDWRELARGTVAELLDPLPSRSLVRETSDGVPTEWVIRNPALTILQNEGWIERRPLSTAGIDGMWQVRRPWVLDHYQNEAECVEEVAERDEDGYLFVGVARPTDNWPSL